MWFDFRFEKFVIVDLITYVNKNLIFTISSLDIVLNIIIDYTRDDITFVKYKIKFTDQRKIEAIKTIKKISIRTWKNDYSSYYSKIICNIKIAYLEC